MTDSTEAQAKEPIGTVDYFGRRYDLMAVTTMACANEHLEENPEQGVLAVNYEKNLVYIVDLSDEGQPLPKKPSA